MTVASALALAHTGREGWNATRVTASCHLRRWAMKSWMHELVGEPRSDQSEHSPYVSLLAIDPRVVLGAIEKHFDPDQRKDFTHANVNGYQRHTTTGSTPFTYLFAHSCLKQRT